MRPLRRFLRRLTSWESDEERLQAGLLIGLPLAILTGPLLGADGISPYSPLVIAIAVASLALSAFVACLIPALRASRISLLDALRAE
jgi:ABC-type antimicrobial peptide transport system permease subunit